MKKADLLGCRSGRLLVIREAENIGNVAAWMCRCDCGTEKAIRASHIAGQLVLSCGCLRSEFGKTKKTHGMSRTRPYKVWVSMKSRCYNQRDTAYQNYGGRGIEVAPEWHRFETFWNDMKDGYQDDLEIDRKDNSLGYSKSNCRWATITEQANNKRNNVFYNHEGVRMKLHELAKRLGLHPETVRRRIKRGAPLMAVALLIFVFAAFGLRIP